MVQESVLINSKLKIVTYLDKPVVQFISSIFTSDLETLNGFFQWFFILFMPAMKNLNPSIQAFTQIFTSFFQIINAIVECFFNICV